VVPLFEPGPAGIFWWSQPGSNRRPPACKAGALPAELWPRRKPAARTHEMVGLGRFELPASPLSGVRSDQLSYRPEVGCVLPSPDFEPGQTWRLDAPARGPSNLCWELAPRLRTRLLLKEVIQPHVPVRLPCYDFTPVISHTVVSALPKVKLPTSGATNSHGVTGGVYKTRERIHRDNADSRLLAIPTSRSRVADSDPDYDRLCGIGSPSRVGNPLYRPL
jgi:hypothetical protein